jgi:type II secretory pathway component PulF
MPAVVKGNPLALVARLRERATQLRDHDWHATYRTWEVASMHAQFSRRHQADFVADLVKLLEDGVQVRAAMAFMQDTMKAPQKLVAGSILKALESGSPLAEGFIGWFPMEVVEAVRGGEAAGDVRAALASVARMLQRNAGIAGLVIGELMYPTMLLVQTLAIVAYIGSEHVGFFQTMGTLLPRGRWPLVSIVLEDISSFIRGGWWTLPIVLTGLIVTIRNVLRLYTGTLREKLDVAPMFSTYRRLLAADVLQGLSLLMANRVRLQDCITLLERNASPYLASHLARMRVRLEQGTTNLGAVLDTGLLDRALMRRLQLLSGARDVHGTIRTLGERSGELGQAHLKTSIAILRNLMLVFVVVQYGMAISGLYGLTNALQ